MNKCGACAVEEGEYHDRGCDLERCPYCLGQLITCRCIEKRLGIDSNQEPVYSKGLNKEQEERWENYLNKKGKIRFWDFPHLCNKCGKLYPAMFHSNFWNEVIPKDHQKDLICFDCYASMKQILCAKLIEGNEKERLLAQKLMFGNDFGK